MIRNIILSISFILSATVIQAQGVKFQVSSSGGTTNTVYQQADPPATNVVEADLWKDTDDNEWYTYDNGTWVPIGTGGGAGTTNNVYRQSTVPPVAVEADIWQDTDDGRWYVFDDGAFVLMNHDTDDQTITGSIVDGDTIRITIEDGNTINIPVSTIDLFEIDTTGLVTLITDNSHSVFEQATAPTATTIGDEWKDTDNGVVSVWNGTAWIVVGQDPALVPEFDNPIDAQNAGILIGMQWKVSDNSTMAKAPGTVIIKSRNY